MRINRYMALATGMSRRTADAIIAQGEVTVNGRLPQPGQDISEQDTVHVHGKQVRPPEATQTVLLNKPAGYVVSRDGQGNPTVYDLLPTALHHLKPVGRLDKDSSGLLLFTNDGALTQQLTHPSFEKEKVYEVTLEKALLPADRAAIEQGVQLEDGQSRLQLSPGASDKRWQVRMHEGRNRQIRRTFAARGYNVTKLQRTQFGIYQLGELPIGQHHTI
jgi:23S rRNA pseudouridine2605 synthase